MAGLVLVLVLAALGARGRAGRVREVARRARDALGELTRRVHVRPRWTRPAGVLHRVVVLAHGADCSPAVGIHARGAGKIEGRSVDPRPVGCGAPLKGVVVPVRSRGGHSAGQGEGRQRPREDLRGRGVVGSDQADDLPARKRRSGVRRLDGRVVPRGDLCDEYLVGRLAREDKVADRGQVVHDPNGRREQGNHPLTLPLHRQAAHLDDGRRAGEGRASARGRSNQAVDLFGVPLGAGDRLVGACVVPAAGRTDCQLAQARACPDGPVVQDDRSSCKKDIQIHQRRGIWFCPYLRRSIRSEGLRATPASYSSRFLGP